ncbi:MAG: hypothetical protein JWR07_2675, partial [Nevskia sp.]|nr:hypothetical protein [Nevskia sp.]
MKFAALRCILSAFPQPVSQHAR